MQNLNEIFLNGKSKSLIDLTVGFSRIVCHMLKLFTNQHFNYRVCWQTLGQTKSSISACCRRVSHPDISRRWKDGEMRRPLSSQHIRGCQTFLPNTVLSWTLFIQTVCSLWSLGPLLVYVKETDVSGKKSDCTSASQSPSLAQLPCPPSAVPARWFWKCLGSRCESGRILLGYKWWVSVEGRSVEGPPRRRYNVLWRLSFHLAGKDPCDQLTADVW